MISDNIDYPQKPLPAIPNFTRPATLTIASRAHRFKFIQNVLSEETRSTFLDSSKENWADVLQSVMDDLGDSIVQGGWMTEIRRGRMLKMSRGNNVRKGLEIEIAPRAQEATLKGKRKRIPDSFTPRSAEEDSELANTPSVVATEVSHFCDRNAPLALEQIRVSLSHFNLSDPGSSPKHFLLCLSPFHSSSAIPMEDSAFDPLADNIGCLFTPGVFSLPESNADIEDINSIVLFGLREWDASRTNGESTTRLVGGTFFLKGVNSPMQHNSLCRALRIAIYIHLSLLIEEQFLADSHVALQYPLPRVPPPSPLSPVPPPPDGMPSAPDPKPRNRTSFLPSGLFSFFSKNLSHRTIVSIPLGSRGGSFDLTSSTPNQFHEPAPRSSEDGTGVRIRKFSFMSDTRSSFLKTSAQIDEKPDLPFSAALTRIEKSKDVLSTSPGLVFAPPTLIVALAERERKEPGRRLRGDERAGLMSILGWNGKDDAGKSMSGMLGFIHLQEFSVLFSQHVPAALPPMPTSDASVESSSSSFNSPKPLFTTCDQARWETYRYYSHNEDNDKSLGEKILDLCYRASQSCKTPGCQFKSGDHLVRFIHGGMRISVRVDWLPESVYAPDDDNIELWESCAICYARTDPVQMSDGTFLLSFAKFLELLVYSPIICTLTPALCEHTTPPQTPWSSEDSPLPRSRLNIVRNFTFQSCTVSFSLSVIDDIFELRVPRLQIVRGGVSQKSPNTSIVNGQEVLGGPVSDEKKILRREIRNWWQGVADHIDTLEEAFTGNDLETFQKALPRLPSSDDAYDEFDSNPILKSSVSGLPPVSPSIPRPPTAEDALEGYFPEPPSSLTSISATSLSSPASAPTPEKLSDPAHLLSSLRHSFQNTERSLYALLSGTPVSSLNDVRRIFLSAAKGASRRLLAWQNKHLPGTSRDHALMVEEPEWWAKCCHAVPGGNVIVREDDWGSIIAFTLGTADYQRELTDMSVTRVASSSTQSSAPASSPLPAHSSSFFTANAYKLFMSSSSNQPDPDQDDVVWHEPEAYSAVISRKEHPRDPTSLLSLRDVLRQKSPLEGSNGPLGSRFTSISTSGSRPATGIPPPSAWANPAVQVNMQVVDGEVSTLPDPGETANQILHEIECGSAEHSYPGSSLSGSVVSSLESIDAHIRRGKASSVVSLESDATIGPIEGSAIHLPKPPTPPPKDDTNRSGSVNSIGNEPSSSQSNRTPSTFASTFTNGLTNAMRFMLKATEVPRSTFPYPKNHHGLLSVEHLHIDERPHIKYDWTIGKRLRFSCTVYYAKQFDILRRRCGIDDVFLKSLGRSMNWSAEGGKSKSNFWKTSDDRFIIKTLVNAWNVADLQVLIELAPSYFRYMDATASKPTVLAKLIGFYTIEIRNLESGTVQSKADLLVMENLFYDQKVVKTFDLKGIQGRKVKAASSQNSKTLFDGEWIEGQQRTLMLVRPHSKVVLHEAIKSDADFLSKSNIMDYSLLIGVDEERKEIACGLVDTIGSYTFAKTLEYKAKQGLSSGKEVTIVPPDEYHDRFVRALDGYFLACPDKWSKPLNSTTSLKDISLLPSVL